MHMLIFALAFHFFLHSFQLVEKLYVRIGDVVFGWQNDELEIKAKSNIAE